MMIMLYEFLIGMGVASSAALVSWIVNVSGRVAALEAQFCDIKTLINARFDSSDARLERVERSMNGFLKRD
jgi:hypothetical protein